MIRFQRIFSKVCSLKDVGRLQLGPAPSRIEATTIRMINDGQIDARKRDESTSALSDPPVLHDIKDAAHRERLLAVMNSPVHIAPETDKTSPSEWKVRSLLADLQQNFRGSIISRELFDRNRVHKYFFS